MRAEWIQSAILRAASILAPGDQRSEWLEEWRSELWYVSQPRATAFCLGAFQDALWLRLNQEDRGPDARSRLESPAACLTVLVAVAGASLVIAALLPISRETALPPQMANGTLLFGSVAAILVWKLLLPTPGIGRAPAPWIDRLRGWLFLTLKFVFVLQAVLHGLVLLVWVGLIPVLVIGFRPLSILAFRWVVLDQRRRCPICLRLLTPPVRIGSASSTFLEWYGTESMCARGHGLMQVHPTSSSCYPKRQWLRLDSSWSTFFRGATGTRS